MMPFAVQSLQFDALSNYTNPEEINGIIYVRALMQFHLAWNTEVLIERLDSFRFSIHLYTNYNWICQFHPQNQVKPGFLASK